MEKTFELIFKVSDFKGHYTKDMKYNEGFKNKIKLPPTYWHNHISTITKILHRKMMPEKHVFCFLFTSSAHS